MDTVDAVGRRKEAVARVRLSEGQGQMTVNGKPVSEYFLGLTAGKFYNKPLDITKTADNFTISIKVTGGGRASQLAAVVHGISRALVKVSPDLKTTIKKAGLLTRDARVKERRKYGHAHKARAKKQSPKR